MMIYLYDLSVRSIFLKFACVAPGISFTTTFRYSMPIPSYLALNGIDRFKSWWYQESARMAVAAAARAYYGG